MPFTPSAPPGGWRAARTPRTPQRQTRPAWWPACTARLGLGRRVGAGLRSWLVLALMASGAARSEVLWVGQAYPIKQVSEAIRQAKDGDTIRIAAGIYKGDVALITQRELTIEGVGGRPVLEADGQAAEGKAIWVIRNGDIRIRNIEFRGARVRDDNGAGIRFERGKLLLQRCRFVDNQNGLLTANFADAELRIEDSEFSAAPRVTDKLHHLLYVGRIGRFEVTGSRFHGGFHAHLIKSRAKISRIAYNLVYDGPGGEASYEIDLPNGGDALVIGNVVGQSASTSNPVLVSFGAEGGGWPASKLLMAHNTLISDRPGAWFLRTWMDKLPPDTTVRAVNNLTVGLGVFSLGASGDFDGNLPATSGMLVAPEALAFGLKPDSLLRGRAADPRSLAGDAAVPTAEFRLPVGTLPLPAPEHWSAGAFQR